MVVRSNWAEIHGAYIQVKDNVPIYFGDVVGSDASIKWDGSELDITAATVNIDGDVTLTGDISIETDDISVEQGYYIYLDGQSGSEYVRAVTDGNAILNGATTAALGVAGTAVITVATATATFAQKIVQDDTTTSTTTTTGSIQTDGGLGVVGTATIGDLVTSTSDRGFATTGTLVPDASRLDYAYSAGNRAAELAVNLLNSGSQNLELWQTNLNLTCASGEPTGTSTVALLRLRATHDTTNMQYLRLRGVNTYLDVQKNLQDVYGCIHGIDFYTNSVAVGGEAAVGVFNVDANSAVTGTVRGIIINLYGAGLPSTTSIGLEVRTDGGTATLAEGIRIWSVGGNSISTGISMDGTVTEGIDFSGVTYTPDSSRTNYAIGIGSRADELTVNLANAASQNFEPFQMNINLTASGGAPTSTSTARLLRIRSTHDTVDMANLRIMNINTYMDVQKNIQAAYGQMNGVDLTGTLTVTTEAAIGVFNMECPSGTVTGNVRGIIVNLYGPSLPSTSIGIEVRSDGGAATLAEGIRIWGVGSCQLTTGLKMQGTLATAFDFEDVVTGVDDSDSEGSRNGRILVVDRNGDTRAILLYNTS